MMAFTDKSGDSRHGTLLDQAARALPGWASARSKRGGGRECHALGRLAEGVPVVRGAVWSCGGAGVEGHFAPNDGHAGLVCQ